MSKEEMIPKYRFNEFTKNWMIKKIGELGTIVGGGTPPTNNKDYWNGNIPWISSSDIPEDKIYDINYNKYITNEAIENSATKLIEKDSILIVTRVGLGKLAINKKDVCTSQDFANLKLNESDNNFISYVLKDKKNEIYRRSRGTTIKGITNEDLKSIQLHIPKYREQQKIGHLFKKLDQAISLQQQVLETTKEYKQSMLQKMFPKKDEKVPEIRFNGFKDLWSRKSLEQIADNYDRFRIPITSKDRIPGDTPYYGSNGIQDFVEGYTHEGNFVLLAEDGANDIDNYPVRFVSGKIWVNNHAHVLKAKDKFDLYFLSNVLKTINMRRYLVGSSRMKLNASTMMTIKMLVPTFKEQQKIGSFFKTLDEKIEQEEKKLETYQSMKKALMQRMFV